MAGPEGAAAPALDNIIRKAARNRHFRRHGFLQDTLVNSPASTPKATPASKKDDQKHERDDDKENDTHIQPPAKRQRSTDVEMSYDLVQIDGVVQVQIEEPVYAQAVIEELVDEPEPEPVRPPSPLHVDAGSEDMDIVDNPTDIDNAQSQLKPQPQTQPIPVQRSYSDSLEDILRRSEELIRNTARHDARSIARIDALRHSPLCNDVSRNDMIPSDALRNDAPTRDESQTTHRSVDQHADQITDQLQEQDQDQYREEQKEPGHRLSPTNSIPSVIKDTHIPKQYPREETETTVQSHPSEQHLRWQSCTFAEWISDGEGLIRRFEDVTRRAQNLMRTKMELFADLRRTIHAQVERLDEQKRQLDERIDQVKGWGDQML